MPTNREPQWADVDPFAKTLTIPKSKTAAGQRVVPLTDGAPFLIRFGPDGAERFFGVNPSHYVFAAFDPKLKFTGKWVITAWRSFDPASTFPYCECC